MYKTHVRNVFRRFIVPTQIVQFYPDHKLTDDDEKSI